MQVNRVFLSHSWREKPLARRIARGLHLRGVNVWIDTQEMRFGSVLDTELREAIEASDAFAVILTAEALQSRYVTLEIETAISRKPAPILLPLIAESNLQDPRFDGVLNADITDPYVFEDRLDEIAEGLGASGDPPDPNLLSEALNEIEFLHPELASLTVSLRDDRQLGFALEAALDIPAADYPALEELLWLALQLHRNCDRDFQLLSRATAALYLRTGLGLPVLRQALTGLSDRHNTILSAIAHPHLDAGHIQQSFRLFRDMRKPDDFAFAGFVRENFDQMTEPQKRRAIQYACVPKRGPGGFAMDLAFALFERIPDSKALHNLWYFWINDDGIWTDVPFEQFASWMARARKRKLPQFDPLIEYVSSCCRWTGRPKNLKELASSVNRLSRVRGSEFPDVSRVERQFENGLGSAETEWLMQHPLRALYRDFIYASPKDEGYLGYELSMAIFDDLERET